jgi:hypothetical protein
MLPYFAKQPFEALPDGPLGFVKMRVKRGEIRKLTGLREQGEQAARRGIRHKPPLDAKPQNLRQGLIEP